MIAFNCNKVNDIAALLNISPQNLNGYIDRGTFFKLIESELYKRKINIDWIKTGQGNMKNEQYETSATLSSPVFDTDTAYQPKINTADLVHKMKAVLRSNTAYSTALKDIILAYYEATICQEELAEQQKESS